MLNLSENQLSENQFSFKSFINHYLDDSPYENKDRNKFLTLKSKIDLNDLTVFEDAIFEILGEALYDNSLSMLMSCNDFKTFVELKRVTESGKFFTRLKKFFNSKDSRIVKHETLQDKYSHQCTADDFIKWKIPEKYIQKINAKISLNGEDSIKDIFDFSNENWEAGKHNESRGSCWWSDYNQGRLCFIDNGGFSIRHYDENLNVMGRSWGFIYEHNDAECLIIFNLYDDKYRQLSHWSDAIKSLFKDYSNKDFIDKNISLYGDSFLWINYNDAIVITVKENQYKIDDFNGLHLRHTNIFDYIYNYDNDSYTCENCGDRINEDESYYSEYNECIYCEYCYNENHSNCAECGQNFHNDQLTLAENNNLVCNSCLNSYYIECDECGDYIHIDNSFFDEENESDYCEYCHDRLYEDCYGCGESTHSDNLTRVEISTGIFKNYCENCIDDDNLKKCNRCGGLKDSFLLSTIDGLNYCALCEIIFKSNK